MSANDVNVTLQEITEETLGDILDLEVAEDQKGFVAPNVRSIAQAHFSEHAWFRAIYAGDTPVGFVMLYADEEKPWYGVWRFMVDERHQRMGYASKAMQLVVEHVRGLPGAKELFLSYVPKEGSALPFYEKCGFVETGEWHGQEKEMKLTL